MAEHKNNLKEIKLQSLLSLLEDYRKKITRFALILFLLPLLFLMLENDQIVEFDLGFFSLKQSDLLISLFPCIYVIIMLYFDYLIRCANETLNEIILITHDSLQPKLHENWCYLLRVNGVLHNTTDVLVSRNIHALLLYLPFAIFFLAYPFGFLFYFIKQSFKIASENGSWLFWALFIAVIWLFVTLIVVRIESVIKSMQENKESKAENTTKHG